MTVLNEALAQHQAAKRQSGGGNRRPLGPDLLPASAPASVSQPPSARPEPGVNGRHNHGGATDKQLAFIGSLLEERDVPTGYLERYGQLVAAGELTVGKASEVIDALKNLPYANRGPVPQAPARRPLAQDARERDQFQPSVDELPDGNYALRFEDDPVNPVRFYKVETGERGRWEGFRFVTRFASEEQYPVRGADRENVLRRLVEDPRGAAVLYGHESERCCLCNRKLTQASSREAGIGPKCAANAGW